MRLKLAAFVLGLVSIAFGQTAKLQVWEKSLSPGLTFHMEVDTDTPLIVNAIRFSPKAPGLRAIAELAGRTINEDGTVKGRLTPTQMAVQESAIAAINGDFFSFTQGAPIGLMVRDGQLLDTPVKARSVFAWGPDVSGIGFCTSSVSLTIEEEAPIKVDQLNQPCGQNQVALYSPVEGTESTPVPNVTAVVSVSGATWAPSTVIQGTVDSVSKDVKDLKVAEGKALIVATGDKMTSVSGLQVGQKVSFQLQTQGFDWEKYDNAIGGGPVLVKDGKVAVDAEDEGFAASFYAKRHPRTAIGRTSDGDIWLVAIDGRQEISAGATLDETAKVMLRLGCVDAQNLDGGGSTCLHLMGVTVNRPSDGVERPVSNGILIFGPKIPNYQGTLKLVLPPKIALTGKPIARLTLDGKPVPNSDVVWAAQGASWIDQGGTLHPMELGKTTISAAAYGQVVTMSVTVVDKVGRAKRRPLALFSGKGRGGRG